MLCIAFLSTSLSGVYSFWVVGWALWGSQSGVYSFRIVGWLLIWLWFFPRASERRVLPILGVCKTSSHLPIFSSSHLLILTSSHLHTVSSSHPLIFPNPTSSHLHIFTSSHLHIFSSSHPPVFTYIFASSHLHTFSSSHLLIFTSSDLHIFSSSHLLILTSSHLHILTSSHPHLLRNFLPKPNEPDLALHQSLPEPSPQPSPETSRPCWTWPSFAPKSPRPRHSFFSRTFSGTLPNSSQNATCRIDPRGSANSTLRTAKISKSGPPHIGATTKHPRPRPSPEPSSPEPSPETGWTLLSRH